MTDETKNVIPLKPPGPPDPPEEPAICAYCDSVLPKDMLQFENHHGTVVICGNCVLGLHSALMSYHSMRIGLSNDNS